MNGISKFDTILAMDYKPPVIKAKCRQIKHPDGRVDVVCEVPELKVQGAMDDYNKFKKANKE